MSRTRRIVHVMWYVLVFTTIIHAVLYVYIGLGIPLLIIMGMISSLVAYASGVMRT